MEGLELGPTTSPVAQKTKLGWILTGPVQYKEDPNTDQYAGACTESFATLEDQSISEALTRFWEIEKIPKQEFLTPEEQKCEEHFKATTFRLEDGRYGVRLPFKTNPIFRGSREIAVKMLEKLKKRLGQNPVLKQAYDNFFIEYLQLNHMEPVPSDMLDKTNVFYIPHHAVFHNKKFRGVFHASMNSYNGCSLNDTLYIGQKLQQDIISVITRWRCYKVVFTCDIVKMFRQIAIHTDDRDWLRIVYDFGQGIQHFRLTTVTYGTASAPFQSLRVLRQIIEDNCPDDKEMRELFYELSYVDDFFGGADTAKQALQIKEKLVELLSKCQIKLDKWASNDKSLLNHLENIGQNEKNVEIPDAVSALGLKWSPNTDSFSFKVEPFINNGDKVTKRKVLSDSSKLFDPLGWLAPMLINFKTFYQDLWIDGLDWDTPLSSELESKWNLLKEQVKKLEDIKIPRWLGGVSDTSWSLHGFSDASKRAYAACLYYVPENGTPYLICAKTRVAPVNTVTIPKLELTAAKFLAELIQFSLPSFTVKPSEIHCWSDSRNVLCLLKSFPAKLGVFEGNRVSKIITTLPQVRWKYVPTNDNPADCASRGITAEALKQFSLWWQGPDWLPNKDNWPKQLCLSKEKPDKLPVVTLLSEKTEPTRNEWITRFSNYKRARRVTAYCLRFENLKGKSESSLTIEERMRLDNRKSRLQSPYPDLLTAEELLTAERRLIQLDQDKHFKIELDLLRKNKKIPTKSKLANLKPVVDSYGILRAGSRLSECSYLTNNEKEPMILDKRSHLARIIVQDEHINTLHGGPQLVLSRISRKFLIIHGKRLITSMLCKCVKCLRYSGRPLYQQMAPLPKFRLEFEYPFATTGVDYAGPIKVTPSKGRGRTSTKGYIAIFICLVTKAVHVEIVSDLTSQTFLAAFERFYSRRNLPKSMYSDNGTTFHGAEKEIKELFSSKSPFMRKVQEYTGNIGITWKFTPPYGPHFGGIWEAAVKSFKRHFKRVIGESTFTFEELHTLAAQIEMCLNSRPICAISVDNRDPVPLTPGHFLVGRPLMTLPPSFEEDDIKRSYQSRWLHLLALKNNFWKQWKKEALHQMSQRNKWQFPQRNLQVGDLVILQDDLTPPSVWPLARVIETHPDKAGLVRVVTIKTQNSTYTRPINKLIYLPIENPPTQTSAK